MKYWFGLTAVSGANERKNVLVASPPDRLAAGSSGAVKLFAIQHFAIRNANRMSIFANHTRVLCTNSQAIARRAVESMANLVR